MIRPVGARGKNSFYNRRAMCNIVLTCWPLTTRFEVLLESDTVLPGLISKLTGIICDRYEYILSLQQKVWYHLKGSPKSQALPSKPVGQVADTERQAKPIFSMGVRMGVPDLSDERQQHTKDYNDDVCLGHALLSKWCIEVAIDHGLFLWVRRLSHRVHSDIPNRVSHCEKLCKVSGLTRMCRQRSRGPSRSTK
jgi:hypothetical protein